MFKVAILKELPQGRTYEENSLYELSGRGGSRAALSSKTL